jgi:hypothetical protein
MYSAELKLRILSYGFKVIFMWKHVKVF